MEQRKALEPQLDLASDNIADDDLTVDLSEAGWATYTNDADGNEPISTDDGLPCIPHGRQRHSNIVAPKPCATKHTSSAGLTPEVPSNASTTPRRRLAKKTRMPEVPSTVPAKPDEIDVLLASDPDGKLVVSRDSYHSIPPSV